MPIVLRLDVIMANASPQLTPVAPGMLASHYAPRCRVVLVDTLEEAQRVSQLHSTAEILDETDLVTYARSLYGRLRDADARGIETVVAVLPQQPRLLPEPAQFDQDRRLVSLAHAIPPFGGA